MWATAFVNIILYIPLALVIKGKLSVHGFRVRFWRKDDKMDVRQRTVNMLIMLRPYDSVFDSWIKRLQ